MFPFSLVGSGRKPGVVVDPGTRPERSAHELIEFDRNRYYAFAAHVNYCEPHWHPAPELIYVLSGRFTITVGDWTEELNEGSLIYINSEEVHSLTAGTEASTLLTVQFSPTLFDDFVSAPHVRLTASRASDEPECNRAVRAALARLIKGQTLDEPPFATRSAVYALLDAIERGGKRSGFAVDGSVTGKDGETVRQAMRFLTLNLSSDISLSKLASEAGLSYYYFSKIFKKICGYNFKEYVTILRVNQAKSMLANPDVLITAISHSCGFKEHKHMIAAFRRYCAMTPTEFRKSALAGGRAGPSEAPTQLDMQVIRIDEAVVTHIERSVTTQSLVA